MKNQKLVLAILSVVALAAISFGIYQYRQTDELVTALDQKDQRIAAMETKINEYDKVFEADVSLPTNTSRSTIKKYQQLIGESEPNSVVYNALQNRLKWLQNYENQLLLVANLEERDSVVISPPQPLPILTNKVEVKETLEDQHIYDSLAFALEKSQIRLKNMEAQLRSSTGGNYLTFKSTKGNDIYYVGKIKNNKANGTGVGLVKTGSRYHGEWKDNKRHGQGSFYWLDGQHYEGSYVNDKREGEGTYFWPNGEKYVGQWKNDKRNGEGTFYGKDGKVVATGTWKNDKLDDQ